MAESSSASSSSSTADYWLDFTASSGDLHSFSIAIAGFTATERFSAPFTIQIDIRSDGRPIDFMPLLGSLVGFGMSANGGRNVERYFHGVLFSAEARGRARETYEYRLTLRPWFSLLELGRNFRIFQHMTAQDIIKGVFNEAGFSNYTFTGTAAGKNTREYCVQFRESDFDFVSRLLEEEGIYYYFSHASDKHTLVLCDDTSPHHPCFDETLQVARGGDDSGFVGLRLDAWERKVSPAALKTTLWDSHFRKPGQSLEALAGESASSQLPVVEIYDYPGGYGYIHDDGGLAGSTYAKIRLQEVRAECDVFHGKSLAFAISTGSKIKVKEETDLGEKTLSSGEYPKFADGEFLVVEAVHRFRRQSARAEGSADVSLTFDVEFDAVPAAVKWRPPRVTPKPRPGGVQTATVVGVSDQAIDVDEYGRVRVRFDWDRTQGGGRTCWLRVAQGWADGGFGHMHIPRVGEEVLVDFLDGDVDRPIITGRVYNSKLTVPYALPDDKTKSTWKSQSVGSSGTYDESEESPPTPGYNEVRFEDKGGSEELYLHAQRVFNTLVRLDETRKTGRDTTVRVGRNRTVNIKKNETVTIETGDETRTLQQGSRTTEIQKDETLTLNTGDEKRTVKQGSRTTEIQQNDTLTLNNGDYSMKVSMGQATFEAMQKITLKVGQNTIVISQTGIELKGIMITATAQAELSAKAPMVELKADAIMTIGGGMVMIN